MANTWGRNGNSDRLYFLELQITVDSDCSHEIKRHLILEIKGMTNLVWGGRREEGSGWGTHVYLWRIHFEIWQNQYNIVKLKNKIKIYKKIN